MENKDIKLIEQCVREIRSALWLSGAMVRFNKNPIDTARSISVDTGILDELTRERAKELGELLETEMGRSGAIVEFRVLMLKALEGYCKRLPILLDNTIHSIKYRLDVISAIESNYYSQIVNFTKHVKEQKFTDFFAKDILSKALIKELSPYVQVQGNAAPGNIIALLEGVKNYISGANFILDKSLSDHFLKLAGEIGTFKVHVQNEAFVEDVIKKRSISNLPIPLANRLTEEEVKKNLQEVFKNGKVEPADIDTMFKEDVNLYIKKLEEINGMFAHNILQVHSTFTMFMNVITNTIVTIKSIFEEIVPVQLSNIEAIAKGSENVLEVSEKDFEDLKLANDILETILYYVIQLGTDTIHFHNSIMPKCFTTISIAQLLSNIFVNSRINATIELNASLPIPQPDVPLPEIEIEAKKNVEEMNDMANGDDPTTKLTEKLIGDIAKKGDEAKAEALRIKEEEAKKKAEEKAKKEAEKGKKKGGDGDDEGLGGGDDDDSPDKIEGLLDGI